MSGELLAQHTLCQDSDYFRGQLVCVDEVLYASARRIYPDLTVTTLLVFHTIRQAFVQQIDHLRP